MPDGAAFCPKCGTAANIPQPAAQSAEGFDAQAQTSAQQTETQQNAPQQPSSWQYQQTPNQNPAPQQKTSSGWSQPQGTAPAAHPASSSKVFRVLAYVPILFWLPLAFDSQNKDSRKFSN